MKKKKKRIKTKKLKIIAGVCWWLDGWGDCSAIANISKFF